MPKQARVLRPHSFATSVSLAQAIDAYAWAQQVERLSALTIAERTRTLQKFAAFCELQGFDSRALDAITPAQVKLWFASLRVSESSQNTYYRRLHSFWVWAIEREEIATANPLDAIRAPRPTDKGVDSLSSAEIRRLVDVCRDGHTMHWRRDLAIVLLLVDTGLRASELCGLTLDGWQQDRVRVLGKGRKERYCPLSPATAKAIWDYAHKERAASSYPELFLSKYDQPLTRDGLAQLLERRAAEAGIRRVHPHMLRHSFALSWHRSGGPLSALQTLLGHSTPAMSLRYGRLSGEDCGELHRSHSPVERLGLRITEKRPKRPR